jgi:hypothetical protein
MTVREVDSLHPSKPLLNMSKQMNSLSAANRATLDPIPAAKRRNLNSRGCKPTVSR